MWQDIKNIYHLLNAFLANVWYGFPSKKLTVIGVTGTDGKTTTTNLIYHILKTAGKDVSVISTVNAVINGEVYETGFHVTTPSSFMIQKFFKKAVYIKGPVTSIFPTSARSSLAKASDELRAVGSPNTRATFNNNVKYMVLEVTSHALDQNRVYGIDFAIGVITNITHEHLDYHKTYDEYVKTKLKLLKKANVCVVNKDDESYKKISNIKYQISNKQIITYGIKEDADVNPQNFFFKTKLIGEFNTYNILAAVGVCRQLGLADTEIQKGVETFNPPVGRQEIMHDNGFTVMVDFAHTPNAIERILKEVKKLAKKRLIHVFGAAGERDASKRPTMGKASSEYADIIILTAEDSRSESVGKIIEEISEGISNIKFQISNFKLDLELKNSKELLFKIPDRQEAVTAAIQMAQKGDFVVITGKGHEQSMNLGKGEELWSDQDAVKKALKIRGMKQ